MNAPFQCWIEPGGDLWVSAGHAIGIHSGATVEFSTAGSVAEGISAPGGGVGAVAVGTTAGQRLIGGSGRNWKISGGPADPDFPTGVFRPVSPDLWSSPHFGEAKITQAGDGSIELHDGTAAVATSAAGTGVASGVASAGTFPALDYAYDSMLGRWEGVGDADKIIYFEPGSGRLTDNSGFDVAVRSSIGDPASDPAGVYVATTYGEDTFNGGSPWSYTVTGPPAATVMTATTHGEDTYNGGSGFTFAAEFEGDISGQAVFVDVSEGTMQTGRFAWAGWQTWTSEVDAAWGIAIDGTGLGEISDATDVVAVRAADASKLYDASGVYEATAYGMATYGEVEAVTSGAPSAGTVAAQAFALAGTEGDVETWNGTTDPSQFIELNTSTGDAVLYDGLGAIAERLAGSLVDIGGSYASTDYGAATYNGAAAFTYDVAAGNEDLAFTVGVTLQAKAPITGYAYVVLEVDSVSNELEGIQGPFFAAALPANTITAKSYPIAKVTDGVPEQIQIGPIVWRA